MMKLTTCKIGEEVIIQSVHGLVETRERLEALGFERDTPIKIISKYSGGYIIAIRDARIAIDNDAASNIYVYDSLVF